MTESLPPLATARAQLQGALDVLETLHGDLVLRRDEAQNEAARDAYDEVLTLVEALQLETRRRRDALPRQAAHHASYVFLLDDTGKPHPLPHPVFVALARGAATAPEFACQTLRVAEWYVRLRDGEPEAVVNEQYHYLTFDAEGRLDWHATPPADDQALPTAAERAGLHGMLFGTGERTAC